MSALVLALVLQFSFLSNICFCPKALAADAVTTIESDLQLYSTLMKDRNTRDDARRHLNQATAKFEESYDSIPQKKRAPLATRLIDGNYLAGNFYTVERLYETYRRKPGNPGLTESIDFQVAEVLLKQGRFDEAKALIGPYEKEMKAEHKSLSNHPKDALEFYGTPEQESDWKMRLLEVINLNSHISTGKQKTIRLEREKRFKHNGRVQESL